MNTPFETKLHLALVAFLTLCATTTIVAAAASSALSAPIPTPAAKRLVVWDGEEVTKGSGWVNPKSCTIGPQTVEVHSGKTALEFMFKGGSDGWPGAGWNWCAFQTGRCGTDITPFKQLSFWMKTKGFVTDVQLNLLCNGEKFDLPEHHTEKVSALTYCPSLLDGEWHKVIIPLSDLAQPKGFDPLHVGELQIFHAGEGAGSFFLDDIAFEGASVAGRTTFNHPGLLNSKAELDSLKIRIRSGAEPWASSFNALKTSPYANPNWRPRPVAVVNARSNDASHERDDAIAAYTQALLWYLTDNEAHARKSAEILNAWSAKLNKHASDDNQAELVAAWCASLFPLAGEILRSSYPKWTQAEIEKFSAMLNRAFLPHLLAGNADYNGNWELSMINSLMCIGVFNDDLKTFERGVFLWRKRVPAYFYLATDGPTPVRPYEATNLRSDDAISNYWFKPPVYLDGLCQETFRDYGHHMQQGLASAINAAEIAFHQGIDLYGENDKRLMAAMEFQAACFFGKSTASARLPSTYKVSDVLPTWEIAYNHFHNRKGFPLLSTGSLIRSKVRTTSQATHNNMAWESLTHAELDSKGDPVERQPSNQSAPP